MKLFWQKNAKFSSLPCLRRLGALPPIPQPPVAGGFAPRSPLASGGWGLRPQTPKTAPPIANFWLRACNQRSQFTHLASVLAVFCLCIQKASAMCENSGVFNSKSVPTYRTITKKTYRTSVPYFLAKIESYRTANLDNNNVFCWLN